MLRDKSAAKAFGDRFETLAARQILKYLSIESEHAQIWLEDILTFYQECSGEESENLLKQHIKKRKVRLPFRVEIACMIEVAMLFQKEGVIEKRDRWQING
jgi:hypothetical protein